MNTGVALTGERNAGIALTQAVPKARKLERPLVLQQESTWSQLIAAFDNGRYIPKNAALGTLVTLVSRYQPSPCRMVDIGCGDGTFSRTLQSMGHSVLGLDIHPVALQRARLKIASKMMDARCLTLPNKSQDAILCSMVLMLIWEFNTAIEQASQILRRNGIAVWAILNPFNASVRSSRIYSDQTISSLSSFKFRLDYESFEVSYYNRSFNDYISSISSYFSIQDIFIDAPTRAKRFVDCSSSQLEDAEYMWIIGRS